MKKNLVVVLGMGMVVAFLFTATGWAADVIKIGYSGL